MSAGIEICRVLKAVARNVVEKVNARRGMRDNHDVGFPLLIISTGLLPEY